MIVKAPKCILLVSWLDSKCMCAHLWLTSYTSALSGLKYLHSADVAVTPKECFHEWLDVSDAQAGKQSHTKVVLAIIANKCLTG